MPIDTRSVYNAIRRNVFVWCYSDNICSVSFISRLLHVWYSTASFDGRYASVDSTIIKVKVSADQEMAQSERYIYSKNRGGNTYRQSGTYTKRTYRKMREQLFPYRWSLR